MSVAAPSILDRIIDAISETLDIKAESIKPESSIMDELATDSLEQAAIFIALEDEFGGIIEDADMAGIHTIQDIVAFIERRDSPAEA
ncbi:MAG: phosphopantetheine-binding protein [Gammaproteobacteria bacterium]|nr:phosphopantetheine-binding protein [Gammaproteobacteria bacterium]MDH3468004.1 phosphopantetheine-binding protein [Gammaproteobacteria bacterium]